MKRILFFVLILVLLGGCTGVSTDDSVSDQPDINESIPDNVTDEINQSEIIEEWIRDNRMTSIMYREPRMLTMNESPVVHPDNPFYSRHLTVYVDQSEANRDKSNIVNHSMVWWTENSWDYAGYPVNLSQIDDQDSADIIVTFEESPIQCGIGPHTGTVLGCAPLNEHRAEQPSEITIAIDQATPESIITVKHELGHVFGLTHDDDPGYVMDDLYGQTNRHWDNITVYIDGSTANEERQIGHALDFYADGAHDTLDNPPSFTIVGNKADAVIVVGFDSSYDCNGFATCSYDTAYLSQNAVLITDHRSQYAGWYFASSIAPWFYDDTADEPEILDSDQSARVAGSNWWR